MTSVFGVATLVWGGLLGPAFAQGQGDAAERSLGGYEAAPECPDRRGFEAMIRSFVDPAVGGTLTVPSPLSASLTRGAGGFVGALRGADGAVVREFEAPTCGEVGQALAFSLALAIWPDAAPGRGVPVASASGSSRATPATSAVASSSAGAIAATPPRDTTSDEVDASGRAPGEGPSAEPRHLVWLGGSWAGAVAPDRAWGVMGAYEQGGGLVRLHTGASWHRRTSDLASGGEQVATTRVTAEAGACAAVARAWPVGPVGCLALRGGVLRAEARGVEGATSATAPFMALVPTLRAEWGVVGPLFVMGAAGLELGLIKPSFVLVGPARTAFEVPLLSVEGLVGVGARFL